MKKILCVLISVYLLFSGYGCNMRNDEMKHLDLSSAPAEADSINARGRSENLKVAVATMISPKGTFYYYEKLFQYLGDKTGKKVVFKQRKTYQEVNKLIKDKKVDLAFICSGAFVADYENIPMELLAVPFVDGEPYYQAYIIVHKDSPFKEFNDLKGTSFAFTDPLSNTGHMYVVYLIQKMGTSVQDFFTRTIYTYAHDYSIQAVAKNIVEGATVDGLVYDYLKVSNPELIEDLKIIGKSQKFGIPPIVTHRETPSELKKKIRNILFSMHLDSTGKEILKGLHIDKFGPGDAHLYDGLKEMVKSIPEI